MESEKQEIQNRSKQQKLAIDNLQSEKEANKIQLSYCNSQLHSKQSQIERLEYEIELGHERAAGCKSEFQSEFIFHQIVSFNYFSYCSKFDTLKRFLWSFENYCKSMERPEFQWNLSFIAIL